MSGAELLTDLKTGQIDPSEISPPPGDSKQEICGSGAHSQCYLSKWTNPKTQVTLPVIVKKALGPKLQRLVGEDIKILLTLAHPNIVKCYGFCVQDFQTYGILEWAENKTLFDQLYKAKEKEWDWDTRLRWAEDISNGLTYLHGLQPPIVHRDIKSPNMLLRKDWSACLCDFGTAKQSILIKTNGVGTPVWMSPEVWRGSDYIESADIWSFGMVMYELLTRSLPYEGEADEAIRTKLDQAIPPTIPNEENDFMRNFPMGYTEVLRKCWNEDPSKRPTSLMIREWIREWRMVLKLKQQKEENQKKAEELELQAKELDAREQKIKAAEEAIKASEKKFEVIQAELNDLKEDEKQREDIKKLYISTRDDISQIQRDLQDLQEKDQKREKENKELQDKILKLEAQHARKEQEFEAQQARREQEFKASMQAFKASMQELQQKFEAEVQELGQRLKLKDQELQAKSHEFKTKEQELKKTELEFKKLQDTPKEQELDVTERTTSEKFAMKEREIQELYRRLEAKLLEELEKKEQEREKQVKSGIKENYFSLEDPFKKDQAIRRKTEQEFPEQQKTEHRRLDESAVRKRQEGKKQEREKQENEQKKSRRKESYVEHFDFPDGKPSGMATDFQKYIFISESQSVRIYDFSTGTYVKTIQGFRDPHHLDYHDSELYVSDFGNSRIQILSPDGELKRQISLNFQPKGLVVWDNYIYIVNFKTHSIHVYLKVGAESKIKPFGGRQLNTPTGIARDKRHLYVADSQNHRIAVFEKDGRWIRSVGENGILKTPFRVHVSESFIYVGDGKSRIQVFTKDGAFVKTIGRHGTKPGEFGGAICGVVVLDNLLHVADFENKRIQKFAI